MATIPRLSPKRIVYLWGAGGTQGEAQHLGATRSLLMRDTKSFGEGVTTRILKRAGRRVSESFGSGEGVDIEKLISLLVISGIDEHLTLAEKLRTAYFEELQESLAIAGVIDEPKLAVRLLEMHNDRKFAEEIEILSGVISTNHDGLLQVASQIVYGSVNLGFAFDSEDFAPATGESIPPILQLHGSFTWEFGVPIRVAALLAETHYSPDTVWIPPTTSKEAKNYPFNKLSAVAYELLAKHCDVLRVVGASLTQNDWNILSLIFNAQRHREFVKGTAFRVELVMPQDAGERIAEECAYLKNLTPIGYLTDGRFEDYKDQETPPESDRANPFEYWLNQKLTFHKARGDFDGLEERPEVAIVPEVAK